MKRPGDWGRVKRAQQQKDETRKAAEVEARLNVCATCLGLGWLVGPTYAETKPCPDCTPKGAVQL